MPDYPALGPNTTPAERIGFIADVQVKGVDMPFEQLASLAEIGKGIAAAQGTLNALPIAGGVLAPLAVDAGGTMDISIGGSDEVVFCGGYVCDGALVQAYVVPAADPSLARVDLIAIQPATVPSGTTVDRNVLVDGVPVSTPISINQHGLNYRYVTGTPGGGTPATPSGFYAFATIAVAAAASGVDGGNVTYLFPNLMQGADGTPGATGHGATTTTGTFVVPAISSLVVVSVGDNVAFPVNAYCLISDGTHTIVGQITADGSGTITVKNLQLIAGSIGDTMANGASVTFSGPQGAAGAPGAPGAPGTDGTSATTTTTAGVVIPAIGATVGVPLASNAAFPVGDAMLVSDGTHAFAGLVNSYSGLTATVTCTAITLGVVGNTVASGAAVVPSAPATDGTIFRKQIRPPAGASTTLTLPVLPGPSTTVYDLYAQGSGDTVSGGSQTLAGTGGTWEAGSVTVPDSGAVGPEPIDYIGTATGGQQPAVTYTFFGSVGSTGYIGVFSLQATPRP